MNNYILLGFCLLLGILFRHTGRLPGNAVVTLNGFIINVSLPALTLTYVHDLKPSTDLLLAALMPWVLFGIGFVFFWQLARMLKLSRASTGGLILTGSLGNTSFIGLPMIEAFYGADHMGLGILIDQLGSYFVLSTAGILVASIYSSGDGDGVDIRKIARKIATFVPFQAFVVALILIPVEYPEWFDLLLRRLGATLVPLALLSVGFQLHLSHVAGKAKLLAFGLGFKLILAPLLIALLYIGGFGLNGDIGRVTVFEAAMAPMIGASIVAMDHDLDPPLLSLMVGIGIPLSFLTLPAWWYLLQ